MNLNFNAHSTSISSSKQMEAHLASYKPIDGEALDCIDVGNEYEIVKSHLGELHHNQVQNFWTFGRYAMQDLLKYVLLQVGPSDVSACTWAITTQSVETILNLRDKGYIKSFKLWIDPRVKVRNPQPLQMLQLNFPIAIAPVHAKVTCISNPDWKVSISGSLNFTSNPQPERGTITTIPHVFEADAAIIARQFEIDAQNVERRQMLAAMDASKSDTLSYQDDFSIPQFDSSSTLDITAKHRAWRQAEDWTTPRCNMIEKIRYHAHGEFSIISAFQRSEEGYEISAIKSDFYNVGRFADSVCKIIQKLIGGANRDMYALVIPPKRRHSSKNFAEEIAKVVAEREHLHFYQDALTCESKQRINAVFTLHANIQEPIVIIFDDIITTGSTLKSAYQCFKDKSVLFVVGINNNK